MNANDELRDMNLRELYQKMEQLTDEEFDDWLESMGLLHAFQVCDSCGNRMRPTGTLMYVCHRRRCRRGNTKPQKGRYAGTFFEHAHISHKLIFLLSYFWAQGLGTMEKVEFETKIGHNAIVDYYQKFRKICDLHFQVHPIFIGGHNVVVEIDESFITARKGRRGRRVRRYPFWLFGGVERGTGCSFLLPVIRRSAAVLMTRIRHHVRPGTILASDMWRAYGGIQALPQRFRHWVINHRYHFVDPANRRIHTQSIESKWQKWRANVRRKYGIHDKQYQEHLWEFNWRERYGRTHEVFFNFWSQVAALYPCHQ